MGSRGRSLRPRAVLGVALAAIVALALGLVAPGCGDEEEDDGSGAVGGARQPEPEEGGEETELTGAALGEELFASEGCNGCHVTARQGGTGHGIGPALGGLFQSQVKLADGSTRRATEDYIELAINDPDAEIRRGYEEGVMAQRVPPDSISEANVSALVAYIKTLD